jgi:hypothetical protein
MTALVLQLDAPVDLCGMHGMAGQGRASSAIVSTLLDLLHVCVACLVQTQHMSHDLRLCRILHN